MGSENSFIGTVCKWIIENHGSNLHEVTIVVPAKRSIRFFSNQLVSEFKQANQASLLPEIITLTDLLDSFSPLSRLTPVEMIFHFYKVYCEIESTPESFEEFFVWAPSLLADFNEIDNYLIDPFLLYRDLRNIKEQEIIIEGWSFDRKELSRGQQNLNEFWIKLPVYYKKLNEYLLENNIGYNGMINKSIVTNIENSSLLNQTKKYVFAGFNAFTKCETTLLNFLIDENRAKVFFDSDNYYLQNDVHEAGLFLRKHVQDLNGNVTCIDANAIAKTGKAIHYYESNGETLQCNEVVKIISAMTPKELERTAIVLCNEQLLPVLINSLPANVKGVNVTMGWPLKFTNASDFFNALIDLNLAFSRSKNYVPPETIDRFISSTKAFLNIKSTAQLVAQNKVELFAAFENTEIYDLLSASSKSVSHFLKACLTYLDQKLLVIDTHIIGLEILAHYREVFNKLFLLPGFAQHITGWYLFKQLFNKFTRNYPLAFVGEPLAGIQVMGMLETRALDFDNVFILSANEGFLPAQNTYAGYIPYDLRAHFKLPGKTEQDAVFAYYFYRLIQRSANVYVFYNTQNELLSQAERSRYLLQIEKELSDINPLVKMEVVSLDATLSKIAEEFSVQKSEFYFKRINELMNSGFSATMLTTYCKCKLDFYNKYVLGFKVAKDLFTMDESAIGNMVHFYFKSIFESILNQKIEVEFFRQALSNIDKILNQIIFEKFRTFSFSSGQNYLALQMVKKMISRFLEKQVVKDADSIFIGKTVVGAEIGMYTMLEVNKHAIKLKGDIDLFIKDDLENYFVFDFKTGNMLQDELVLTKAQKLTFNKFAEKGKLMQLLIYKKLVQVSFPAKSVSAMIIPLAKGSDKFLKSELKDISEDEITDAFFSTIVDDMLNAQEILAHNPKSKYCEFCN